MRYLLLTFACLLFSVLLFAQDKFTAPKFVKTAIDKSGCYAYLPVTKEEKKFDISYSPDSAKVYTGDFGVGDFHYSVILVKLNGTELSTTEDKENMMIAYLDYLKQSFEIVESAGYGKGHTLENNPNATGIIDYWKDKEDKWSIKAWADKSTLAVMMIYGVNDYPNINVANVFLNGFRFE